MFVSLSHWRSTTVSLETRNHLLMQMLWSDWLRYYTLSAISVQWLEVVLEITRFFFRFLQIFGGKFGCKRAIKFLRSLNEGHLRFLNFQKSWNYWKSWCARAHNFAFKISIQSARSFSGVMFNNTSRNNWKPLFEVNFSKNLIKTIRLFALDFY